MSDNNEGAEGFLDQSTTSSEYNAFFFKVMSILTQNNFVVPVKVMAVTSTGELAMTGLIDVQPIINQDRADGILSEHGVIRNIAYLRMQGGTNAIIMDPAVGDIGLMMCADKDISTLKATRDISNAASARVHDYADGVYMGGLLNGVPTQYVQFNSAGIEMNSPAKIKLTAPVIELTATTSITEAAPNIAMNASTRVATTAPDVTTDATTVEVTASTSVTSTTPNFRVIGAAQISGLASLNGGFSSLPVSGGGASTINSALNITGATGISGQTTLAGVTAGGKNIGGTHTHSGVQPGGGTSGGPT
jgi:hypothetical protein